MTVTIGRRELLAALGGAAAWPLAARAQQPTMPVIGILHFGSPEANVNVMAAFRQGLGEAGYVDGRNVAIEYRWAYNDVDRLPQLAADLVRRRVALIVTPANMVVAFAAKAATTTIPIVFNTGTDPVKAGLVASLNLPKAMRFAILVNRSNPDTDSVVADLRSAAASIGCEIEVLDADTYSDIVPAVASLVQRRADAFLINPGQVFYDRRTQLLTLAARYRLPAIYPAREWADAGGLMSYGSSFAEQHRQAGIYAGRVLKGEKPADLPILRATKFELVINLQTAKALDIDIPPTLLARADEVIE